jgi:anti-sigma factor ChrR (cupin superfamily)
MDPHQIKANDAPFVAFALSLEPVAPSANLRARVMEQLSPKPKHLVLREEGEFLPVLKGVAVKRLRLDETSETSLWRLDPGAAIPAHTHHLDEECLIVSGAVQYAGRTLVMGDYLGALKGEHQDVISTIDGALLLIRGERLSAAMLV